MNLFRKLFPSVRKSAGRITKLDLKQTEQRLLSAIALTIASLKETENRLMASQAEIVQQLNEARAQLRKVSEEQSARSDTLLKKIAELEAIIAAGGTIGQDLVDAAAGVKAEAQALDDLIPDAPPTA